MKCIYCGTNSMRRDRWSGRCPKCRHPFTFEPATDPHRVTDVQFKKAIERVSANGKMHYTERQLWYLFNHRWTKPGFWRSPFAVLPFLGAGSSLFFVYGPGRGMVTDTLWLIAIAVLGAVWGRATGRLLSAWADRRAPRTPLPPRVPFKVFESRYLRRWREVHGDAHAPLPVREVALSRLPRDVPADVAAFSFDRVVVTEHWDTAQMLVANRFHFEHNCAVLSRDGYPDGTAETVKEMLRRNPALTVFALHDASSAGCLLPLTLREPEWFPEPRVRIVDLGLRPETVRRAGIPALRGAPVTVPPPLAQILSPREVAWLEEGHLAELAGLRPEQVMRAAYRGIVAAGRNDGSPGGPDGGGGGDSYYGAGIIWVGDLSPGADTAAEDGFG